MSKTNALIIKARGLNTQPNELDVPEGSLRVAENVEVTRDNVVQLSPGFADYSANMPDFEVQALFAYGGTLYAHADDGIWYDNAGAWTRKGGADNGRAYGISYGSEILYIVDGQSYSVRALNLATGAHYLIAGRPGTSGSADGTGAAATFTSLTDCWFDGSSTLYVTDQHAIRAVNVSTRVVTTVCGAVGTSGDTNSAGTLARFTTLRAIVGDGTNLYVNDLTTNGKIKKIPISTFLPSTLATPGAYAGQNKIAYDGTYVYYKSSNTAVDRCNKTSGATSAFLTVAGATTAYNLHYSASYIYYSAAVNASMHEIRRAAVSNSADSFVTLLDNAYSAPGAIYVDSGGHIYFAAGGVSTDALLRAYAGFGTTGGSSGSNLTYLLQKASGATIAQPSGTVRALLRGPD